MARSHHSNRPWKMIVGHVIITSILSWIINTTVLGISITQEKWIFGDVACQLFALISFFLISTSTWMIAFAAFERLYKVACPGDHAFIFSYINTKILISGIYMMTFVLCTGPMYGWGEYSDLKGKMEVVTTLIPSEAEKNEENVGVISNNTMNTNHLVPELFCSYLSPNEKVEIIDVMKTIGSSFISSKWREKILVRPPMANCNTGKITYILRAKDVLVVNNFFELYESGNLSKLLMEELNGQFYHITQRPLNLSIHTRMDHNAVRLYKTVFIPFQRIGVCSLDFSPVNDYVVSSTLYILVTTVLIPYGVIIFSVIALLWKCRPANGTSQKYKLSYPHINLPNETVLKTLLFCGVLSLLFSLPYFLINFMMMGNQLINKGINILCTFLFYNSSVCSVLPYILFKLLEIKKRAQRSSGSRKEIIALKEVSNENSTNDSSIQYGSV